MTKVLSGLVCVAIVVLIRYQGSSIVTTVLDDRPRVYKSWSNDHHWISKIEIIEDGQVLCLKHWRDPKFLKVLQENNYKEVWVR